MADMAYKFHRFPLRLPFGPGEVNVYLLTEGRHAVLVDAGPADPEVLHRLEESLASSGIGRGDIQEAVMTHYHPDHCGLAAELQSSGVRIIMSRTEAELLEEFMSRPERDSEKADYYGRHPVPDDFREQVSLLFPIYRSLMGRFRPDRVLEDGEEVHVGGVRLRALVTPGHTAGHLALWNEEERALFCGDTLLDGVAPQISLRPEILDTDPLGAYLETLERLMALGPAVAWPGHGDPIRDPRSCSLRIIQIYKRYLDTILSCIASEPRTAFDICGRAFPDDRHAFGRWISLGRTIACLCRLRALGKVEESAMGGDARSYRIPD